MLSNLILRMSDGSVHNHADLARSMGVSVEMLAQLISELDRRGYVTRDVTGGGCAGLCKGCASARQCTTNTSSALGSSWRLTPQGLAYAKTRAAVRHR